MKKTILYIIIPIMFFSPFVYSLELKRKIDIPCYKLTQLDTFTIIELDKGITLTKPGEPIIPSLIYHFILPPNTRPHRIKYKGYNDTTIFNINLKTQPALKPDLISQNMIHTEPINPDSFPFEPVKILSSGSLAGNKMTSITLSPFVYYPREKTLKIIRTYELTIELEPDYIEPITPLKTTPYGKLHYKNLIFGLVDNKEDIARYSPIEYFKTTTHWTTARRTIPPDINDPEADFVIISPDPFSDELQELVTIERKLGLNGVIVRISEINGNYHGFDIQEKIRKFLVDAHRYWGIWAVILAGSYENLPLRICSGVDQLGQVESIPTIFYYLQLDGTFNFDRDDLFGEEPEDELYPELVGGVLPFTNPEEIRNYISKMRTYIYETNREYTSNWIFMGASLTSESGEYTGQTAKETICRRYSFPYGVEISRLYSHADRTGGDHELNFETFINSIRNGAIFINHIDHSSRLTLGAGYKVSGDLVTIQDIDRLSNEPYFPLFFTFSCYTTNPVFDNISRHWVLNPHGGGIGFIGTTGAVWTTQIYADQYFIESLLEPQSLLGEIFKNFLIRIMPDRYLIFAYHFDGNPLLDFYYPGEPESLVLICPDSIPNNHQNLRITCLSRDSTPASEVRVIAVKSEEQTYSTITDETGVAELPVRLLDRGYIKIYASGRRWLPAEDSVKIYIASSPYFHISSWALHNEETATAQSGILNYLDITVKNMGSAAARVNIKGRAISPTIFMVDSTENPSATLNFGDSLFLPNAFSFIADTFSGTEICSIALTLTSTESSSTDTIRFFVYGPKLKIISVNYLDTTYGNGDLLPNPLERGELVVRFLNSGKGRIENGKLKLSSYDPEISIITDTSSVFELRHLDTSTVRFEIVMGRSILYGGTMFKLALKLGEREVENMNIKLGQPSPPERLSWQGSEQAIMLSWQPPSAGTNFIYGYLVYRATSDSGEFALVSPTPITIGTFFNDSPLPQKSTFYYYVTTVDSSMNESVPSAHIKAWTTFPTHSGFPVKLPIGTTVFGSAAVGDVDGDNRSEIFIASHSGKVFAFKDNGEDLIDITLSVPDPLLSVENGRFWGSPILDDFFGDGEKELLVCTRGMINKAYLIRPNGEPVENWPISLAGPVITTPLAYDFDGDNRKEIVIVTENKLVYIFRPNGRPFLDSGGDGIFARLNDTLDISAYCYSSPAASDIDNDGEPELIVAGGVNPLTSNGILYAFDIRGRLKNGFPVYVTGWINSGIALGNLDENEQTLEIVFATAANYIYAVSSTGEILDGFPVWLFFQADKVGGPAVADINNDGKCEIAIAGLNYLYLLDYTGRNLPGWPLSSNGNSSWTEPAIVDIDNDAIPELIFVNNAEFSISAYKPTGELIAGFPLRVANNIYATPTIASLSDSAGLCLIATTYDEHVYVWDLGAQEHSRTFFWSTARGNQSRTGISTARSHTGITRETHNKHDENLVIFPNPFNSALNISCSIHEKTSEIDLFIVDITGKKVVGFKAQKSVTNEVYTTIWKPENVSSGLYFVVLKTKDISIVKKALYIK